MATHPKTAMPPKEAVKEWEDGRSGATPEDFELVRFIEENGATLGKVYIYRITKTGDLEHVATTTIEGMSEDLLRENYGAPAHYSLKFKGSDGRWKAERRVRLGAIKIDSPQNGSGVPAQNAAGDRLIEMQLRLMEARAAEQSSMMNSLITAIAGRGSTGPDPATMLTSVVTAFTALRGAAADNRPAVDPIDQISRVMEIVRDVMPGGKAEAAGEESVWGVVKEIGTRVVEIARPMIENATRQVVPVQAAPVQQNPPVVRGQLPAAPEGAVQTVAEKTIADWIAVSIGYLKAKARAGKDVDLFVDWILENGEEPQNAALIGALQQGATFDHVLQFDSEIAQNPALKVWFKSLYDGLHTELFSTGVASLDSKRTSGNAGDASGNGDAGAPGSGDAGSPVVER